MPLAELQTITGVESGDQADQILVSTNDPSVRSDIERLYPGTDVVSRTGLAGRELSTSSLPLAMAVSSFLVALTVGVLFVATMMGLELTSNRRYIAMLGAVGFSTRSRSLVVFAETLSISVLGGVIGIGVGAGGIVALNRATRETVGVAVARFEPLLLGYGLGVAVLIGVLAAPYPVWLSRRLDTLEVLAG
jgi:putative ABC transport system permease protein